jgi:hypothetical protein
MPTPTTETPQQRAMQDEIRKREGELRLLLESLVRMPGIDNAALGNASDHFTLAFRHLYNAAAKKAQ